MKETVLGQVRFDEKLVTWTGTRQHGKKEVNCIQIQLKDDEKYPKYVDIELHGDKRDIVFKEGDILNVKCYVNGSPLWSDDKKAFASLSLAEYELVAEGSATVEPAPTGVDELDDDDPEKLPF